jgi:hypothetical protein
MHMHLYFVLVALTLGCGGDATPQYAMVIDEGVVTVGSRDGRTTLSSGEWTGTIDGELWPYGEGGAAVGAGVIAVRLKVGEATQIAAHELATGRARWRSEVSAVPAQHAPLLPLVIGATAVLDVRHEAAAPRAALFALDSGARINDGFVDPGLVVQRAEALGPGFIIIGATRAQLVVPDREGRVMETRGDLCVDGAGAWGLGRRTLIAFEGRATRELSVTPPPSGSVVACGRRDGQLVFLVSHPAEQRWEVNVVSRDGGPMTTLGGPGALDERALMRIRTSGSGPWRGELPRVVPLIVDDADGARPMLVDLETRQIKSLASPHARWKLAAIARAGAGHAVLVGRWIVVLDGEGRVGDPVQIEGGEPGAPTSDGRSLVWVDHEGRTRAFFGVTVDHALTGTGARGRSELGLQP